MGKIIERIFRIKHVEYLFLTLVLLLGFGVRLYKITNPIADWHSWRQADTAAVTRNYVKSGLNLLWPKYDDLSSAQSGLYNPQGYRFVEFPLYNTLHFFLFKLSPQIGLEVWGRLTSTLCALVSAVFLFLIGKRFLGKWGGVLTAFFFLVLPFNIYFTRVILPEPMGEMFALISLWSFIIFIDKNSYLSFYASAFFMALALLIKPFLLFYTFPMGYLLITKYGLKGILKHRKLILNFIGFALVSFLPLVLWRLWIGRHPEGIPFFTWAFNGDRIRFRLAFWRWIFGERIGRMILGIWGLVPFTVGVILKKKNYFTIAFLLGALAYVFIVATASVRHDYYQIFIIPPLVLLLAEGSLYLWQQDFFNKWLSRIVLVFSLALMVGMAAYQIKDNYLVVHYEIIAAGQTVDKLVPKDAKVIAPYNGDTAFLYQTQRQGWPVVDDSFDNLIKKGASYYVSVDLNSADTKYLETRYKTMVQTPQYILLDLKKPIKK